MYPSIIKIADREKKVYAVELSVNSALVHLMQSQGIVSELGFPPAQWEHWEPHRLVSQLQQQ
jgi:hypothetical protein